MAKRSGVSLGVLALAAAGAAASLLSDCADSTSWYYEDRAKTCEAYVSKKSKNCKKKDEFKVGRSALARRQKLVTVAHSVETKNFREITRDPLNQKVST